MAFNGSGTFNRTDGTRTGATVWAQAKAALVKIVTSGHDTHDQDLADGLTNCICKDGQTTITQNIPMNSKKLTGLAAGTGAGDSVRYEQLAVAQITSGTISGITDLAVADGGTGASTGANACINLGAARAGANSDIESITQNTNDGSDSENLAFCGGGANSLDRGAALNLFGNEAAGHGGEAAVFGGNVSSGNVILQAKHASAKVRILTSDTDRIRITGSGFIERFPAAVTAAGSVQGDATAITSPCNLVTCALSGRGVLLPAIATNGVYATIRISNINATQLKIYPNGSETIASASYMNLNGPLSVELIPDSSSNWVVF